MEPFGVIDMFAQASMWSAFKQGLQIKVNSTTRKTCLFVFFQSFEEEI